MTIPTFNRRELVELALKSALDQTRPALQVIVICDGCTDGTQAAVAALGDDRVEVLDLPKGHGYGYAHRNVGLDRARGDVVMWLGDDDLYTPDHLETIGRRWDAGDVDLVQARACLVHPDDRLERMGMNWDEPRYRRQLLSDERNLTPMGAVSARTQLARGVGGWRGDLARRADWDLWKRLLQAGARHSMLLQPTMLHFQATGRVQEPADRLRQNRAFAAEIADQPRLERLRSTMAEHWATDESWLEASHEERGRWIDELDRRGLAMMDELATLNAPPGPVRAEG